MLKLLFLGSFTSMLLAEAVAGEPEEPKSDESTESSEEGEEAAQSEQAVKEEATSVETASMPLKQSQSYLCLSSISIRQRSMYNPKTLTTH